MYKPRKSELDSSTNSRVYRILLHERVSGCPICSPHNGCNAWKTKKQKNWKKFRKTKWK